MSTSRKGLYGKRKPLKSWIVPVVHTLDFGCEMIVEARTKKGAIALALKHNAEMSSGDGYDWDRSEIVGTRLGTWDKIKESP